MSSAYPVEKETVEQLLQSVDWANSSLGQLSEWPESLKTVIGLILSSPAQIVLFWGEDYLSLYNDAYAPTIGNKHPQALGRPAIENWAELWDDLEPLLAKVRTTGEAVVAKDRQFYIERSDKPELVTFDIAYSAVPDAAGNVAGVLCIVAETTERTALERQLRESQAQLLAMTNSLDQIIWAADASGHPDYFNARWYEFTGLAPTRDEMSWWSLFHPDDREHVRDLWNHSLATGDPYHVEYRLRHHSGQYRWMIGRGNCIYDQAGRIARWFGSYTDIHDLKMADLRRMALVKLQEDVGTLQDTAEIAHASAQMLGEMLDISRVGYGTIDTAAETITIERDWNAPGITTLAGVLHFRDFGSYIDDLKRGETVVFADAYQDPRTVAGADALKAISAQAAVNMPITEMGGLVAIIYLNHENAREWTREEIEFTREVAERTRVAVERRRAENELRDLTVSLERQVVDRTADLMQAEEYLRQSQKMEAVGQLTGGIAHDFNNMLAVIIGGLNLLQRKMARGETDVQRFIDGAMEGAQRAATLTQRLLAFSRQQPLAPEPLDANRLISGMSELLTRTLGEHIRVETVLAAGLWKTKADLAQLENVLINLAVNARDAMVDGGRLTIETNNASVSDDYAKQHHIATGQYVLIAVSDTGIGMTPEIVAKAFEPFFTTKGVGKGTGLGLSQVFGFVRQSGGHVKIYSEVGHGTTLKIYLPRFYGEMKERTRAEEEVPPSGSGETILVVEDEERVRAFTIEALRELGYHVLSASNGADALKLLEGGADPVLLLTDIVMPGMNGRQLAEVAKLKRPGLKVLYATGYTRNAIVHNGMLDPGTNFLQKPFGIDQLSAKVRSVLDTD